MNQSSNLDTPNGLNHRTASNHTNRLPVLCTSLFCLMMAGCASLSKQECQLGNWQAIGYTDGVSGYYSSRIQEHQRACARVDVSPNYKLWEKGRKEGLKEYCTKANAYRLGKQGTTMNDVCPDNIALQLENINNKGKELYELRRQINRDKEKLEKYQDELEKLSNGEMLHFKSERDARNYLLELDDKIDKLEMDIEDNQYQLEKLSAYRY